MRNQSSDTGHSQQLSQLIVTWGDNSGDARFEFPMGRAAHP